METPMNTLSSSSKRQDDVEKVMCAICGNAVQGGKRNLVFCGSFIHPECFVCATCRVPLLNRSFYEHRKTSYCARHYAELFSQQLDNENVLENIKFSVSKPAEYQVANYNIHPPFLLQASSPLPKNFTIRANLVDATLNTVLFTGFQSGDIRMMRKGQPSLVFSGLKLSKLGPIKTELDLMNVKPLNHDFKIQVVIGCTIVSSDTFQIVSSCSHVPMHLRNIVRPRKYDSKGDEEENEDSQ